MGLEEVETVVVQPQDGQPGQVSKHALVKAGDSVSGQVEAGEVGEDGHGAGDVGQKVVGQVQSCQIFGQTGEG